MELYCKINVHADYEKPNTIICPNVRITPYIEIDL